MPELQDLYDIHRNPTGEQFFRGEPVPEGRYRLGVQVWIRDDTGRFLLSQRHPCKKKPLLWEATGGAVDAGEDTRTAAVREVSEEIGLSLKPERLVLLCTKLCEGIEFLDTYLAVWNGSVDELAFQENEVVAAKWVTYEEMEAMDARGELCVEYKQLFCQVRKSPAAVCPMMIEDYDQIIGLWRDVPGMGLNNLDDSREGVERFLKRNHGMCFVVKTEDGLAGTVLSGHDGRRGGLYHLAVRQEQQGKGFGRALVNAAADALRQEGISKVSAHVFASNEEGNRFWDKMGFANRSDIRYRSLKLFEMEEIHT